MFSNEIKFIWNFFRIFITKNRLECSKDDTTQTLVVGTWNMLVSPNSMVPSNKTIKRYISWKLFTQNLVTFVASGDSPNV